MPSFDGTIIDGIGNELLLIFTCFGTVLFVVLAWMSTRVHWELWPVHVLLHHPPSQQDPPNTLSTDPNHITEGECRNDEDVGSHSECSEASDAESDNPEMIVRSRNIGVADSSDHSDNSANIETTKCANQDGEQCSETLKPKTYMTLRLQFLNDETRYVRAAPTMSVIRFKRKHFADELFRQNKNVRLIYQGRELGGLRPDPVKCTSSERVKLKRLCDYGIKDGSTIHCLISAKVVSSAVSNRSSSTSASDGQNQSRTYTFSSANDSMLTEFDIGTRLMKPLFAFLLLFTWFFRIVYRQYFNSLSTFALVALTVFFCGAVFTVSFVNAVSAVSRMFGISTSADNMDNSVVHQLPNNGDHSTTDIFRSGNAQMLTMTVITRRSSSQSNLTNTPTTGTLSDSVSSGDTVDNVRNSNTPTNEEPGRDGTD